MLAEVTGPKHGCSFDPLPPGLNKLVFQSRAWISQPIGFTRFEEPLPLSMHTVQQFNAVLMRLHNRPQLKSRKQTDRKCKHRKDLCIHKGIYALMD